jgi:hypothetical protein
MPLGSGTQLGPYKLLAALVAGGPDKEMCIARWTFVSVADVALKVLPSPFTTDPNRLGRFKREGACSPRSII